MIDPIPSPSGVSKGRFRPRGAGASGLSTLTRRAAGALAASLLAACVDSTGPPFPRIEETEFAPSLGIDLAEMTRIDGGIYVLDLAVGKGAVFRATRSVGVSYSLHLADGTHVQSREGFRFRIGCRDVISGLEAGVTGMLVGGRRKVIVPGRWGFGPTPPWGIDVPYGAILVYVVEALDSRHIDDCNSPA